MSNNKNYSNHSKKHSNYNKNPKKRRKRRQSSQERRRELFIRLILIAIIAAAAIVILLNTVFSNSVSRSIIFSADASKAAESSAETAVHTVDIDVEQMLLTVNEYSRPGIALTEINGIVIHYTANPGTTAEQNRSYYEGLKTGEADTYVSSHFIIGLDGEIIQCIPLDEIAYASNDRNYDTISIECCHPDDTGEFTDETYQSLINLVTWLCEEYGLESTDVIRHYDVTGKECPLYFVEHEDAWEAFRSTIASMLSASTSA